MHQMRTRGLPTFQGKAEENRGCQFQTVTHCGPERGLCHLICVLHRRLTAHMRTFTRTKQLKAGSSFPPTLMGFLNVGFRTLQVSCARVWESAGSPFCHSHKEESAEAFIFLLLWWLDLHFPSDFWSVWWGWFRNIPCTINEVAFFS